MRSVQDTCEPRPDILAGTFNPEVFTASLPQVLDHYRGRAASIDNIYTDPGLFFTQATYATDGLKRVLGEVFGRLSGDSAMPAIHRLETAFGGGKTHTLIACAHLAFRGKELAPVAGGLVAPEKLLAPGAVSVVGIAGDEIRVARPKGTALVPHTLWGEIAYQVGGKELYTQVDADSAAFTEGKEYFEKVFGGRKVLVMLDELANYATRLEGVRANGAEQLAAFLMGLHGYARRPTSCVSVVLTLAGAKDAFARQTRTIARLLSDVKGESVSEEEALRVATKALGEQQSVVARDATPVTPVEPREISRVLTKRLFLKIDVSAANEAAAAYAGMYQKNRAMLPEAAATDAYRDRIVSHYPFHPSLTDYLNQKLSTVETFQGTRGVLRLLARTVRSLWGKARQTAPTVHASHLNLRDPDVVGEVLGRTGNSDLKDVLTADVGSADSAGLEGGTSNAEAADRENKHPSGFPLHEYTWRVVFLHSLVGRDQGLNDNKFGISEPEALLAVAFPDLPPSQVQIALKKIKESAYYLRRSDDGSKYFASLDPSPNVALMKIYRSLQGSEKVADLLVATARKVVRADVRDFHVATDVAIPEHIPDNKNQPVLAIVSPKAGKVNVEEMVTTAGPNKARGQQNTVLLLVPTTVVVTKPSAGGFMAEEEANRAYEQLLDQARWVFAARALKEKPQDHGINPAKLAAEDFDARVKEREIALVTAVTQAYSSLWFHSAGGSGYVRKEVKTAGGEGGAAVIEVIRKALREDGELVTAEDTTQSALAGLAKLFFQGGNETVSVAKVRENFWSLRHWPMLEGAAALDRIVREGVTRGQWCVFRMASPDSTKPDEFFDRGTGDLPLNLDLMKADYSLVTPAGARKRNWGKQAVDADKVKSWVRDVVSQNGKVTVGDVAAKVVEQHGEIPKVAITEAVASLLQEDKFCTVPAGKSAQLISGPKAALHNPAEGDVLITKARAAEDGLLVAEKAAFRLTGKDAAAKLLTVLKRADTLFNRGVKAHVDTLQLLELELPKGGTVRIDLEKVPPESLKQLGELFGVLTGLVRAGQNTDAYFEVNDPPAECPLLKELGR